MKETGDIYKAFLNNLEPQALLEGGIQKWKQLELESIANCDLIIKSTENMLLRTLASIIKNDSQKHYEVLDVIQDALSGSMSINRADIDAIGELIDRHIELEENALAYAEYAAANNPDFIVHQLLSYLVYDEDKHHKLLEQLRDYHKSMYPTMQTT